MRTHALYETKIKDKQVNINSIVEPYSLSSVFELSE